jgi:hypothetical protein
VNTTPEMAGSHSWKNNRNGTNQVSDRSRTLRSLSEAEDRENEIGICFQSDSTSLGAISVCTFGGISLPVFFPTGCFTDCTLTD